MRQELLQWQLTLSLFIWACIRMDFGPVLPREEKEDCTLMYTKEVSKYFRKTWNVSRQEVYSACFLRLFKILKRRCDYFVYSIAMFGRNLVIVKHVPFTLMPGWTGDGSKSPKINLFFFVIRVSALRAGHTAILPLWSRWHFHVVLALREKSITWVLASVITAAVIQVPTNKS